MNSVYLFKIIPRNPKVFLDDLKYLYIYQTNIYIQTFCKTVTGAFKFWLANTHQTGIVNAKCMMNLHLYMLATQLLLTKV